MKDKAYLLCSGRRVIGVAASKRTARHWCLEAEESERRSYKEIPVIHSADLIFSKLRAYVAEPKEHLQMKQTNNHLVYSQARYGVERYCYIITEEFKHWCSENVRRMTITMDQQTINLLSFMRRIVGS